MWKRSTRGTHFVTIQRWPSVSTNAALATWEDEGVRGEMTSLWVFNNTVFFMRMAMALLVATLLVTALLQLVVGSL